MFQAKVNEDASGDVTALQQEIRKLKVLTSGPNSRLYLSPGYACDSAIKTFSYIEGPVILSREEP